MQDYEFKSDFMKKQISSQNKGDIKDYSKVNFTEVLKYVASISSRNEIADICSDINSGNINMGMDSGSVDFIIKNENNDNIKYLISNVNKSMSIDVNGLKDLGSEKFKKIQELGCNIDKVYVNSGYDVAAARGYSANVYNHIINKAEKMIEAAMKKIHKDASEEQRFMAIYNIVLKNTVYDYDALKSNGDKQDTSRNLEGFFVDGTSICAGTADALKQLCEMNGIEAEYVQGNSKAKGQTQSAYHAWIKVKIDGKWYNADPTWDANKVGKPYEYCLKSDKDFKGHTLDNTYNPSYSRDGRWSLARRQYHSSYESRDSSSLESKYYTNELRERAGGRALTDEEIEALNGRPDNSGIAVKSNSIIEIIINAILNFGSWTKSKIKGLFTSNKISKEELESLSGKSVNEVEEYAKSIHIDEAELKKENVDTQDKQHDKQKETDEREHSR